MTASTKKSTEKILIKTTLTKSEQDALGAMVGALIDEAKKHGFDLMGIDQPAVQVREAVSQWLIVARRYKPVPIANGSGKDGN